VRPELFRLFDLLFPSYFTLLVTGFMFATLLGVVWARRIGQNPDVIVDLGIAMLIAGVAGGRILHVLVDGYFWDYVHLCTDPSRVDWPIGQSDCISASYGGVWDEARKVCHPRETDCFAWAKFWAGGLTYYGGLIGASAAAVWLLRRDKFPFWKAADMAGFAVPLGLAFGRMGCLLAGCCYGKETSLPWGLSFPPRSPASLGEFKSGLLSTDMTWSLHVHPTQIYESAGSLAVAAAALLWVHPRKRYDGQVFLFFIVSYALVRFAIEFLRSDDRGGGFGLSTSQWLGLVLAAAAFLIHKRLVVRTSAQAA
jgi:phosphatidylglycerol:prolipoprotein diacylglycerol transferase